MDSSSYKVDLHLHSWFSDGTMKPTDLVRMYQEQGYDMISLTDHDGVDGVQEAVIAGEALRMKVIPGIELGTDLVRQETGAAGCGAHMMEMEVHILGYYIDIEDPELTEALKEIRKDRQTRNTALMAYLAEKGYELSPEDLIKKEKQTYIGKPDFVRALKKHGYDVPDVWTLLDGVKRKRIPTDKAMALIRGAGGIAVLAHPMKLKALGEKHTPAFWDNLDALVGDLKKQGLKGMECYHPSASDEESLRLVQLAEKYHLHITQGSDFHGN